MAGAQWRIAIPAAALIGLAAAPAAAQRPLSAEQRVIMLEQQLSASQAAALRLEQRLDSIERQLQQLINQGEVGGHRIGQIEAELAKLRSELEGRIVALESRPVVTQSSETASELPKPAEAKPKAQTASGGPRLPPSKPAAEESAAAADPGEEAYSAGYRLWRDGKYDEAIAALRDFTSAYPKHRRVSYANNLIGRALLDKGEARPAAEALLANYRSNPKGERAADSLYYLGQSLVKLGQPAQACKAYAEAEDFYGAGLRDELKSLLAKGKAEAGCS
ncbi:MAG: tetratricopeptide repeat protein [Alphaproteobacteria bacterium]